MPEKLETLHHLLDQLSDLNHAVFERIIFHLARSMSSIPGSCYHVVLQSCSTRGY